MINGEGVPVPEARTVRLKVPTRWLQEATRATLPPVVGPPQYKPQPDTLASLLRCLWCLTQLDQRIPTKYRKCPCCGKLGSSSDPLYGRSIFVEYF